MVSILGLTMFCRMIVPDESASRFQGVEASAMRPCKTGLGCGGFGVQGLGFGLRVLRLG